MNTETLASRFKAFSEPVRLRILFLLLKEGELCVCDLVETLALPQSVVSRHLAYLRNHHLVSTRRKGVWIYYQVMHDNSELLLEYLQQNGKENKEMQADLARLKSNKSSQPCS